MKTKRTIYWDNQDPNNSGPAYRDYENDQEIDSGLLEFEGFPQGCEGYNLADYFGNDGEYLGPDEGGIEPIYK